MSIKIYRYNEQAPGEFNSGEILENKPVVLDEDEEQLKPYSNLFYWAHAWSEKGSAIGEHPHRAFEIMSFINKGSIEHYDSHNKKWLPLEAGDVQIIRAGSGISHSEKINAKSEMFQIWFDPDLNKTINIPASYGDYKSATFPVTTENGLTVKVYTEDGSNFEMVSPGISIKEYTFTEGDFEIRIKADKIASAYLIEGNINLEEESIEPNDFMVVTDEDALKFSSEQPGRLFVIETPVKTGYRTYAERYV